MTDTNVSSLVLKKGSNRYIFDPSGNLDLSNYYTKSEADGKYALKTDLNKYSLTTHTHSQYATTSAVTNAQNTANNALNVANSKTKFGNSKAYIELQSGSGNTSSVKATHNAILGVITSNNSYNYYVDGFNIFINSFNYTHNAETQTGKFYLGTIQTNSTVSASTRYDRTRIGTYFY